jgi:hypothetical protein
MERKSLSCADTAKLIRADLKTNYPHVKFSVRSSVYSGGASIRVSWVDGPFIDDVERIAKRYEGASFDGSIDLKSYKPDTLMAFAGSETPVLVSFGSDYVFTDRELSPAYIEQLSAEAQKVLDLNQETAGQIFNYSDFYSRESLASDFGVIPYPVSGYSLVRYLSRHIAPSVKVGA